jgi:hypothetical protein
MSERPEELERLDTILGAVGIAHQTIYGMHRELIENEPGQTESPRLVAQSAEITIDRLPRLIAPITRLGARWHEQSLLAPGASEHTALEIAAQMATLEPEIASLLARQREIAARLRDLLAA